jgi:hypothetical protein
LESQEQTSLLKLIVVEMDPVYPNRNLRLLSHDIDNTNINQIIKESKILEEDQ